MINFSFGSLNITLILQIECYKINKVVKDMKKTKIKTTESSFRIIPNSIGLIGNKRHEKLFGFNSNVLDNIE